MAAARKIVPPPPAPAARVSGLWAAGIIAAVCLVYGNTLRAPFIFDDGPSITLNESIRHLWPIGPVLQPPVNGGPSIAGRPLINLSLAANYAISGLDPWSYHAANLIIHALAALTLFGLVRRTLEGPVLRARFGTTAAPVAFGIALLWAVHPLQTESVTCVIQRTESLVGLFYLLTLYGFVRAAAADSRPGRLGWSAACVAACTLGMATKEVMVTAPVIVLLYDRTFVGGGFREAWRRHRWLHCGLFTTWALLLHLLAGNPLRGGTADYESISSWQYLLTQCRAVVLYLRLSVWPHPLVLDYGAGFARTVAEVWPQAVLLVVLAGGTLWALVRRPVLGFLGAWWFVILAPSSSVVPLVTQTIAEHRVYLPLAAVIALGVGILATRAARLVLPACIAAGLLFGGLAFSRNRLYQSVETIWRDNLAKQPDNPRAYLALATVADKEERFPDAVHDYEEYMRRKPDDTAVEFNFARDLVKAGRRAEAMQHFESLLRKQPGEVEVRINYGASLITTGRLEEAARQFQFVLQLRHGDGDDHFNLAETLAKLGRLPEALAHYQQAVALKPDMAFAQYRYGNALLQAKRPGEAAKAYRKAVRLKPDLFEAWVNLGGACLMTNSIQEAVTAYETALRLKPDDQSCRANLEYARGFVRLQ